MTHNTGVRERWRRSELNRVLGNTKTTWQGLCVCGWEGFQRAQGQGGERAALDDCREHEAGKAVGSDLYKEK